MKRTKIIPIRIIPEHHDTDWDGVPNYRDCDPWNPKKHTSRFFVKSTYYPEIKKTGSFKSQQIREWRLKEKNRISKKLFGRSYSGLSTEEKRKVDAVCSMYEKGVTIR